MGFLKYLHYSVGFAVVILLFTSIGNFQLFISKQRLHFWDQETSVLLRFLLDAALILLFVAQHSLMASEWLKSKLATWLDIDVSERLINVAVSCVTLMFLILEWQSIPETYLWYIDTSDRTLLWLFFLIIHVVCWFVMGLEILIMDFGEMCGITQIQRYHNSLNPPFYKKAKKLREIYSRMRHPGTLMLTLMLWIHPLMTLDRLLLASTLTSYMIGRHSFEDSHYQYAEKYFTVQYTEKKSKSSVHYEYVQED